MAINTSIDLVSSIKDLLSYWDFLLFIASLLIVVPFVYIGYLKNHTMPDKKLPYHFGGEYTARDIIKHIEDLEVTLGKKFSKFKKLIELFDKDTEGDVRRHSEIINSALLCIKLNGRKRLVAFWDLSDAMLKVIILLLPLVIATIVFISYIYYGLVGFILSLIPILFITHGILIVFSYFLKISQNLFRKKGKPFPALSLAFLAVEALINSHVSRSYDSTTKNHYYFTMIHKYNNEVNAKSGFSKVHVLTSSEIYGSMEELTIGEK